MKMYPSRDTFKFVQGRVSNNQPVAIVFGARETSGVRHKTLTFIFYPTSRTMIENFMKLLSNLENCEHLKYFGNVYCVVTNHTRDQAMQENHKATNYLLLAVAAYS